MKDQGTERSCGTLPYTVKNGVIHYLLIKSKSNGDCGFPKGHIEAGESETETAVRETWEETSLRVDADGRFRYEISYRMSNGNLKTVVYFPARFCDEEPRRNNDFEDFDYLVLPFDKAYEALTFENTKQMLKSANEFLKSSVLKPSPVGEGGPLAVDEE
jgi:8-oxo-dGTP pyrophosphatase MutT (NUDIX family)